MYLVFYLGSLAISKISSNIGIILNQMYAGLNLTFNDIFTCPFLPNPYKRVDEVTFHSSDLVLLSHSLINIVWVGLIGATCFKVNDFLNKKTGWKDASKLFKGCIFIILVLLIGYVSFNRFGDFAFKKMNEYHDIGLSDYVDPEKTNEEEQVFNGNLFNLLKERDLDKVNDLLEVSERDIDVTLERVKRGKSLFLKVIIKNISSKKIPLALPFRFSNLSNVYDYKGAKYSDMSLSSCLGISCYFRLLSSEEIYEEEFLLHEFFKDGVKGKFTFAGRVSYSLSEDGKLINGVKTIKYLEF